MIEWFKTYIPNRFTAENSYLCQSPSNSPLPNFEQAQPLLPEPFWEGHESTIASYWKAWEIAFRNLRLPTEQNGFVSPYIDTAFNGHLFMWDSAFILLFARYGQRAFNFQQTLDNLYCKQHPDGFICREIDEADGADMFQRFDPPATGPNIMPWTEWEYYQNFGDRQRLERVFPVLVAFHQWMRRYRTWPDGTYWASGWACGMDNQPRLRENEPPGQADNFRPLEWWSHDHMTWIDTCLQAVLSAQLLLRMADVLGRTAEVRDLLDEITHLSVVINSHLWDDASAFYYDRRADGSLSDVKSIGSYWALLAEILPADKLDRFLSHLENPLEFKRPHRIPTLSADHPDYQPNGQYWRGSVWAPTNYMALCGLARYQAHQLAHEIALNHLDQVVKVFEQTSTLWENYAPEFPAPGSIAGRDFVGWTGLPPIAVLFEFVFGLRANVPANTLVWDVRLLETHGVRRYPFGPNGLLDLECAQRENLTDKPVVTVRSTIPLTLDVQWECGHDRREINPF